MMKIYTKTGDRGQTSLIGGVRVPKNHLRIESYGTLDELNSYIGLVRELVSDEQDKIFLKEVQDRIFTISSSLASDPVKARMKVPGLSSTDVVALEEKMDAIEAMLPELTHFILPGGGKESAFCHVARCVCRRAERLTVELAAADTVDELILVYLNRLSDYLFVLARKLSAETGNEENVWHPRF